MNVTHEAPIFLPRSRRTKSAWPASTPRTTASSAGMPRSFVTQIASMTGSHVGLIFNRQTYRAIATALAAAELPEWRTSC